MVFLDFEYELENEFGSNKKMIILSTKSYRVWSKMLRDLDSHLQLYGYHYEDKYVTEQEYIFFIGQNMHKGLVRIIEYKNYREYEIVIYLK